MQIIDFLPQDYGERRLRHQANFACLGIGAVTVAALALTVGLMMFRLAGVRRMRDLVDRQYSEAGRQIDQLKQLEKHKAGLLRKVELSAALLERVPRSLLVARLTNALPQETSLTVLSMRTEEIEVEKPDDEDGKEPQPKKKSTRSKAKDKPETVKITRIAFRVDGTAPTNTEVAHYMAALDGDPLFENVDMDFADEFQDMDGRQMRRFRISFFLSREAEQLLMGDIGEQAAAGTDDGPPQAARGEPS